MKQVQVTLEMEDDFDLDYTGYSRFNDGGVIRLERALQSEYDDKVEVIEMEEL